jgi:hypothetical protein
MCSATSNGCSASTNASGVAIVEFTVTRQPGDNFAIAAGVIPAQVGAVSMNGIELNNGSGQIIPTNCTTELVCRSEMLTVWRRLHIEVDSMGESIQNRALGTIDMTTRLRFGQTVTVPVIPSSPAPDLEENRFENGVMIVNFRSFPVTCVGGTCNEARTVTIRNPGQTVTLFAGYPFELYDDDDFNDDDGPPPNGDGSLDGDTGENISAPNEITSNGVPLNGTALLTAASDDVNTNAFAAAYVRPVYDVVDPTDDAIFQANTTGFLAEDLRPLFTGGRDLTTTNTDNEFWTVYLLGAYQHTIERDHDPSTESPYTAAIVDAITLVTDDLEGSGALIFTEINRPTEIPGYTSNPTNLDSMAVTVAHEIGHLFSCVHGDGGLLGTDPNTGTPVSNQLSPTMIRKIKVLLHP